MIAGTADIPVNWMTLADAAEKAGTQTNVLRKHRTPEWEKRGLAKKSLTGEWWVDPSVLATIKPIVKRSISDGDGHESNPLTRFGILPGLPTEAPGDREHLREAEQFLLSAVTSLMRCSRVPYAAIGKINLMAKSLSDAAESKEGKS